MFYKAPKDMIERKDLSDSEKMLLVVLTSLASKHGYSFATNAKLASMVGWSVDKLRNNLRTLAAKGIVAHEIQDGNQRKIYLPKGGVQFHTGGGVQNDTGGCEDLHRGVCNSTQGGVQNDPPLHNRTLNRIDNRINNRGERASALAPSDEFFESGDLEKPITHTTDLAEKKEKVAPKRKKFVPPSIEEAEELFLEVNMKSEAAKFIDYYEANGWKVGRNTMKDWKAAARNWARRQKEYTKSKPQTNGKPFDDLTQESFYETVREHVEQKQRDGVIGDR